MDPPTGTRRFLRRCHESGDCICLLATSRPPYADVQLAGEIKDMTCETATGHAAAACIPAVTVDSDLLRFHHFSWK